MAQPDPKEDSILICGVRGERAVAEPNSELIATAFNAATAAEDMGYDGQAAVEKLPELLALVVGIRDAIDFTGNTFELADDVLCLEDKVKAVLTALRAKEHTS